MSKKSHAYLVGINEPETDPALVLVAKLERQLKEFKQELDELKKEVSNGYY